MYGDDITVWCMVMTSDPSALWGLNGESPLVLLSRGAGGHHAEDGLPAAGPGGAGARARGSADAADLGHHPREHGAPGGAADPPACPRHHRGQEPALLQRAADSALGGGALQEEEAV